MNTPHPLPVRLRGALLVASLLLAGAAAAQTPTDPPSEADPGSWAASIDRDLRVGFTPRTGDLAGEALARAGTSDERAAALLALGVAGVVAERPRLRSLASEGPPLERRAAVLALGELGASGSGRLADADRLLEGLIEDPDTLVAECALLALLWTGSSEWRSYADELAADSTGRLATAAANLLVYVYDPVGSRPTPAAELHLELRWRAAREFGTVDGRSWSVALLEQLKEDQPFLDAVVLRAAADLKFPGIQDHLLELLLERGGTACVRAVVHAMPARLDELIESRLWQPASDDEWRAIVDGALEEGVASLLPKAMRRATAAEAVAPTAAGILARGDRRYARVARAGLTADDPRVRARAARAVADGELTDALGGVVALEADPDVRVRAVALVSRIRLGDERARHAARELVDSTRTADRADRSALIEALGEAVRTESVAALLEDVIQRLDGADRAGAVAGLQLASRVSQGNELQALFDDLDPDSRTAVRTVLALGSFPTDEDLDFLAARFPMEGHRELNITIALVLARNGHPAVLPLLQHAVWTEPWNRSVLAAAVVKQTSGVRLLRHWIAKPPSFATSADIRRLGFAIGEWGGLDELRNLARSLGGGADRPALQGALLGALASRTH